LRLGFRIGDFSPLIVEEVWRGEGSRWWYGGGAISTASGQWTGPEKVVCREEEGSLAGSIGSEKKEAHPVRNRVTRFPFQLCSQQERNT
jgi:hypothetical protein